MSPGLWQGRPLLCEQSRGNRLLAPCLNSPHIRSHDLAQASDRAIGRPCRQSQPAAPLADPSQLGDGSTGVADKHDTERRNDGVNAVSIEGQDLRIAYTKIDGQACLSRPR